MRSSYLIGALSLAALAVAVKIGTGPPKSLQHCRSIPGDASWPTEKEWDTFNATLDGKLIATVPIAATCHTTLFGKPNPSFDQVECDRLRDVWFYPSTHLSSSSSPMAYPFSNDSCNPFSPSDLPCTIGYHAAYSVNATTAFDIQKALEFVQKHNIRQTIRNSGHDYLGRSTGAHSLSIWTHHMKDISLIKKFTSKAYSGPAIKVSAGVEVHEAYAFADKHGLMVVGGNCPTVGIAGGYTQGGGHGPLASRYGLAADQVLEWEVVTAAGHLVTASPSSHPDLFWALRGGGGSTFGVVVSMTIKAYPDTYVSTANLQFFNTGTNTDALYTVVRKFLTTLPGIVDQGVWAAWVAAPFGFTLMPAFAPSLHKTELDHLLQPTIDKMKELNLTYSYSSAEYPTFVSAYNALPDVWNVSDYNLGGRLMPRSLVVNDVDAVLSVVRSISSNTLMSAVSFNLQHGVSHPDEVAVNPYMRKSIFNLALGTPINYTSSAANKAAQDEITKKYLPLISEITKGDIGAYGNEADFQEEDFKTVFYGKHYDRLERVKKMYDPLGVFYAKTAVGSDRWTQMADGRLCRV